VTTFGALAVTVLRYSSDINKRSKKKNTGKLKKIITKMRTSHQKADKNRVYAECKEGGRGLLQIEGIHKAEITNIAEYLNTKIKRVSL
jgi:hypothetical protein